MNKAILLADFKLENYDLPIGYLIPPIPGRLDYLLHIRDFISEKLNTSQNQQLRGLDIGTGANGIYCILGAQYFNWKMIGIDSDEKAIEIAGANDKMEILDFSFDFDNRYTFWSGILGGTFLMLSYFGTDQSQVQRYLSGTCRISATYLIIWLKMLFRQQKTKKTLS